MCHSLYLVIGQAANIGGVICLYPVRRTFLCVIITIILLVQVKPLGQVWVCDRIQLTTSSHIHQIISTLEG